MIHWVCRRRDNPRRFGKLDASRLPAFAAFIRDFDDAAVPEISDNWLGGTKSNLPLEVRGRWGSLNNARLGRPICQVVLSDVFLSVRNRNGR